MERDMDNLIEQLRARANSLAGAGSTDLLTQAADTLAAQARLLDLAGTMAEPASAVSMLIGGDTWKRMQEAARAFSAAQAEYQTTGTVPCPECEAKDAEIKTLQTCWDNEKRHNRSLDHQSAVNADLRRQLAEADADKKRAEDDVVVLSGFMGEFHSELNGDGEPGDRLIDIVRKIKQGRSKARAERDDLRRQLAEAQDRERVHEYRASILRGERDQAQADNAALVEALSKYGEHTGGDSETGNSDETSCGCGLWNIRAQPHPGAGLLERMANLERENEALRNKQ